MSAMRKHDTKDAEKISALAYEMWEKAGRPDTDPDKFWYEAEQDAWVGNNVILGREQRRYGGCHPKQRLEVAANPNQCSMQSAATPVIRSL